MSALLNSSTLRKVLGNTAHIQSHFIKKTF